MINNRPARLIRIAKGNNVSPISLRPGSLVLYKIHPALVSSVADKIELQLPGGRSKRVRDKDVQLLHPGPTESLVLDAGDPAIEEAWELLEGEEVTLGDLAELLYGENSPAAAWGAWQILQDQLYFEGDLARIRRRDRDAIEAERSAREARRQEEEAWSAFLERVRGRRLEGDDRKRLAEVERLALGSAAHSRILKQLDVAETAEAAHRFLVSCGYWGQNENPWPQRAGANLAVVDIGVPALPDEPRRDLTHLAAWAIDDAGNQDPDDAISIDRDRLWVHVADVAALVRPGGHLDAAARERAANLYLPERIHTMLPERVTETLGLGLAETSPALSIGFSFDGDAVGDIEIVPTIVRVNRTTYDDVDARMGETDFVAVSKITDAFRERRLARGAARIDLPEVSVRVIDGEVVIRGLPKLASRDMVTDAMLMAGEAAARFANEHGIAIPYAMQPPPEEIRQPQSMAEMYAYRRLFKPSRAALAPEPHFGLGLDVYARTTSPLRRYADLVVHQQLRAFVTGGDPQDAEQVLERTAALDAANAVIRKAERLSNLHWKLVFLATHPEWQGEATIVALEERKSVAIINELAFETRIRRSPDHQLNGTVRVMAKEVDLAAQAAYFQVLG